MRLFQLVPLLFMLLSLVVSACGGSAIEVSPDPESPARTAEPGQDLSVSTPLPAVNTSKSPATVSVEFVPEEIAEKAKTDLMQRLSISEDQIRVVATKAVTWPDASLGCPQPGIAYAQGITQGYVILLGVNGKVYEYHADMLNGVNSCDPALEENGAVKDTDTNVVDGWPNQSKDDVIIKLTPTKNPGK